MCDPVSDIPVEVDDDGGITVGLRSLWEDAEYSDIVVSPDVVDSEVTLSNVFSIGDISALFSSVLTHFGDKSDSFLSFMTWSPSARAVKWFIEAERAKRS